MSALGATRPGSWLADMMLGISQQIIMQILSTFFAYAAAQGSMEAFNYLPITFLLVIFAMTCKHPDPNVILGVNPQSCLQAAFGRITRRSYPDWNFSLFWKDMSHNPLLGFIWEEKILKNVLQGAHPSTDMESEAVTTAAQKAMFSDIKQLQVQALCAFFHYHGDMVFAFLNYRECFFLFEFPRPSNFAFLADKYKAWFPDPQDGKNKPPAIKFDRRDLPRPKIHYYARSLRNLNGSALSPVFKNAFRIATSHLGLLENQFPLFRLPPGTPEEDLAQPGLDEFQKALDEAIENRDADVFEDGSSDPIHDDSQDSDFAPGSSSESSDGSLSTGASDPPLSAPLVPNSDLSADNSSILRHCPRCRALRDKKKQAAKKKRAAKKQAAVSVPAEVEHATSSSRRGDCTERPRDVADSPVAEPLAPVEGTGVPEDTIRVHYPPSHGVILTDPITPQGPPRTVAHKRESPHKSDSPSLPVAGSSDMEDEGVSERLAALPTGYRAARAPKASNAAAKTEHAYGTRSRMRAEPVAPVPNQDEDVGATSGTSGQRNPAGAVGLSQVALPAQAGRAEANTRRSQPRADARIAASRTGNVRLGTRSKAQFQSGSGSNQKRKHVGDSDAEEDGPEPSVAPSKKRKFPAGSSARNAVTVEAGGSAMPLAGPSNSQGLPACGPVTPLQVVSTRKRDKKKGRAG